MSKLMNSRFQRGSGVYQCRVCSRSTRFTGGDGADVKLCDECYELAGEENHLSDCGEFYASKEEVLALIAAVESKGGNVSAWAELKAKAQKA